MKDERTMVVMCEYIDRKDIRKGELLFLREEEIMEEHLKQQWVILV